MRWVTEHKLYNISLTRANAWDLSLIPHLLRTRDVGDLGLFPRSATTVHHDPGEQATGMIRGELL